MGRIPNCGCCEHGQPGCRYLESFEAHRIQIQLAPSWLLPSLKTTGSFRLASTLSSRSNTCHPKKDRHELAAFLSLSLFKSTGSVLKLSGVHIKVRIDV